MIRLLCALGIALLVSAAPARAADDFVLPTILPITGNAAFIGKARQATLQLVEGLVNQDGGINGHPLRIEFHDDQSTPQVTVQITNSIQASHPSAMLGASITGTCSAQMPLLTRAGPVAYCFSPGVHPPKGSYMFSVGVDTHEQIIVLFRAMQQRGWHRIAVITSTDATGQEVDEVFGALTGMPEFKDMEIVSASRFNLNDVTVAAQIERIKDSHPDALIAWTTGTAVAGIFKGLLQAGLDIPVVTSNGNMSNDVMRQFADFLPHTLLISSSVFAQHDGLFTLDPRVEARQKVYYDTMRKAGLPIDYLSAAVWDSTFLLVDVLRRLGVQATAAQVRDDIAGQSDFAGINGVYDFTRVPQRGLDASDCVIWRWDAPHQAWVAFSKPGGAKL